MRFAGLRHRQDVSDLGMQFVVRNPGLHGLQAAGHEVLVLRQHAKPETMRAQAPGHHGAVVKLVSLASGGAVDDDAPEGPAAAQTLGGVFAAEHLEDGVDAFAIGHLQHALLVVKLAVVDAVVEPELGHALQLLVGRRGAVVSMSSNLPTWTAAVPTPPATA